MRMAAALVLLVVAACAPPMTGDAGSQADGVSPVDAGPVTDGGAFVWREMTPCPLPRFEAMGGIVGGRLLVMGGFTSVSLDDTTRVHEYDVATDTWRERASLPGLRHHGAWLETGGTMWLVGGFLSGSVVSRSVWLVDDATDAYDAGPSLPEPRAGAAAVMHEGRLQVLTGLAPDGNTDQPSHVVLVDGGWQVQPSSVPNPRNHLGGAVLGNRLYVVGGRHGWDETAGNQSTFSAYDFDAGTWVSGLPDLPLARSEIAASTFAHRGRLYVIGGAVNPAKPSAQVFVYVPGESAWRELPSLPSPRKGAVAGALGDRIVVSTGSPTGVDPSGTTWVGCCLE